MEQAQQEAAEGGGEEAPPEEAPPEEGSQEVPIENAVTDIPERIANIESKNIKNPELKKSVMTSTWIDSLSDQGYQFPIIKQISPVNSHANSLTILIFLSFYIL